MAWEEGRKIEGSPFDRRNVDGWFDSFERADQRTPDRDLDTFSTSFRLPSKIEIKVVVSLASFGPSSHRTGLTKTHSKASRSFSVSSMKTSSGLKVSSLGRKE
ncbi:hypothetical protein V1477_010666 [Vespula maculifrons]|uniref:Uncharacterized protein n=2 Tax=Vespula TaxID=7451 RepID=A0A834KF40_VESVU|nr:hypothetical protein HZH66_004363 [Vespula vulgaris]